MTSAAFPTTGKAPLIVFINTKKYSVDSPDPRQTLTTFLRSVGLKGTKLGCAEG